MNIMSQQYKIYFKILVQLGPKTRINYCGLKPLPDEWLF